MTSIFLSKATQQFSYYKDLVEKTVSKLSEDQLFWQYNQESNSIAVIMKHMSGNMLSRWTDIFTSDGEKPWRKRDEEFMNDDNTRIGLMDGWDRAWDVLFSTVGGLTEEDLDKTIYIRQEPHTVMEAVLRNLAHCSYHVGQIVYIGKMLLDQKWESLSIPRHSSDEYNASMLKKGRE